MNMNEFKDSVALDVFGRTRSGSLAKYSCVCCGRAAIEFRDELSRREYRISGLCQICQDAVFVEDPED